MAGIRNMETKNGWHLEHGNEKRLASGTWKRKMAGIWNMETKNGWHPEHGNEKFQRKNEKAATKKAQPRQKETGLRSAFCY